ncbi:DEAD/DEAH box helicase family protein [Arcticibacter eurypsychrophilus]|uniref:DEAD/DEAH box helicase family protein n=1 Tax=Arcticibacter eurypsychrophilus TaxID=1434752 RepID=UPI000AD70FA9|nr:DEAD/DEAH box helicase family protein [Arcticibacter eurypsychrophilus]
MPLQEGIYEQLITKIVSNKLANLKENTFFISSVALDKAEASRYLSQYLSETINFALNSIKGDGDILKKIEISNQIVQVLIRELPDLTLSNNLIENEGKLLQAVFNQVDFPYPNLAERIKQIMPYTRLSQSELFTGSNSGLSLESEIKKEILSSDEICWLVSFIKFSGIRIFKQELEEFTNSGRKLRIITTTYMGATDVKAVEFLAGLKNTEIKVSYNTAHERLHAKAYLFLRNSSFDTGYIGSSNISRSALTNGLEWNLKVTTKEVGHIIDKFKKTFDTYWEDKEFEHYKLGEDKARLQGAISKESNNAVGITAFFNLDPYPYQTEILEKLATERTIHQRYKNLLVAATGTGKTVISAFDYKRFKDKSSRSRLLFIAHKKEILIQAQETFRHVLRDANFGELWVDGLEPASYDHVFASVQTLNNRIEQLQLSASFYDFIIIDEVHHISASSYRPILEKFEPQILLGLTATPERMDGDNILRDFCHVIAAEIRLPEAMNRKLLCPFQYFAVSDTIDLDTVAWKNGRYESKELTKIYTKDDRRVAEILSNCDKYLTDLNEVRALGFCVSTEHARYMAEKFIYAGLKADYLTGENAKEHRASAKSRLRNKEINYLFVVDIFNEGVDVPELDTVLFLRPTESLTIFLQQLGRGLRLAEGKDCLTVLDFVGQARAEYDFEHKFRSLVGKTHTSILKEIEDDFPHLPLGCSIILEKKAKEVILQNIQKAFNLNRNQLISKIVNFSHQSTLVLNLANFTAFYRLELAQIYKRGSWKMLCADAGIIPPFTEPYEREISRCIKRLMQGNSISYFRFIQRLIAGRFVLMDATEEEQLFQLMFHYDVWLDAGPKFQFGSLEESLTALLTSPVMV